jgi:predicted metal-dependent phosphoesterase TrpH
MEEGWHAADLHVHTVCSRDVMPGRHVLPEVLYSRAEEMGMRFVTFTDHDTLEAHDILGWDRDGLVSGVEIKVRDEERIGHTVHINVFELNHPQFEELGRISERERNIETLIDYLRDEQLPFSYNHPFWFEPGEEPNLGVIPSLFQMFPVVEYNMQRVRRKNHLTVALAEKYGRGVISTTDSHTGQIGQAYTLARGDSFSEFFWNIARGDFYLVPRDLTVEIMTDQMARWLDSVMRANGELEGKKVVTGFSCLDHSLKILLEGLSEGHSRLFKLLWEVGYWLSKSRIPAFLYLQNQRRFAREISRNLVI